ncbi:MAG: phosphoglucosamine mutase [Actinomycetota bacterium]|nr:phosphoglucosamine mutase [Actinomycetota bacterium]
MTLSFGTDGVRGPTPQLLDEHFVACLATAASDVLSVERWIMGRDTRESGPALSQAIAQALAADGRSVVDAGVVPTPVVAHLSNREDSAGVVVSASHNLWSDNGVKIFAPGGRKLRDQEQLDIENRLTTLVKEASPLLNKPHGVVNGHPNPLQLWYASIETALEHRKLEDLHIVIDCANGSASHIAETLFTRLGARVEVIHASPDGRNINQHCGSTHPSTITKAVLAKQADLGLAVDGDADRLIAVASDGTIINGDRQLCLFAKDLAQRNQLVNRSVVATVMSNLGLRQALEQEEISLIEVPVGDRNVLAELDAGAAILGGEQSGHLVFRRHATTGDGLLSGALLADLVCRSRRNSSDLANEAMHQFPQVLINVPVTSKSAPLPERCNEEIVKTENRLGQTGRVLVRASGTEPVIRIMVEAIEAAAAQREADHLANVIKRTMQ